MSLSRAFRQLLRGLRRFWLQEYISVFLKIYARLSGLPAIWGTPERELATQTLGHLRFLTDTIPSVIGQESPEVYPLRAMWCSWFCRVKSCRLLAPAPVFRPGRLSAPNTVPLRRGHCKFGIHPTLAGTENLRVLPQRRKSYYRANHTLNAGCVNLFSVSSSIDFSDENS